MTEYQGYELELESKLLPNSSNAKIDLVLASAVEKLTVKILIRSYEDCTILMKDI